MDSEWGMAGWGGAGRGLVGEKDGRVKGDSKVFGLSDYRPLVSFFFLVRLPIQGSILAVLLCVFPVHLSL